MKKIVTFIILTISFFALNAQNIIDNTFRVNFIQVAEIQQSELINIKPQKGFAIRYTDNDTRYISEYICTPISEVLYQIIKKKGDKQLGNILSSIQIEIVSNNNEFRRSKATIIGYDDINNLLILVPSERPNFLVENDFFKLKSYTAQDLNGASFKTLLTELSITETLSLSQAQNYIYDYEINKKRFELFLNKTETTMLITNKQENISTGEPIFINQDSNIITAFYLNIEEAKSGIAVKLGNNIFIKNISLINNIDNNEIEKSLDNYVIEYNNNKEFITACQEYFNGQRTERNIKSMYKGSTEHKLQISAPKLFYYIKLAYNKDSVYFTTDSIDACKQAFTTKHALEKVKDEKINRLNLKTTTTHKGKYLSFYDLAQLAVKEKNTQEIIKNNSKIISLINNDFLYNKHNYYEANNKFKEIDKDSINIKKNYPFFESYFNENLKNLVSAQLEEINKLGMTIDAAYELQTTIDKISEELSKMNCDVYTNYKLKISRLANNIYNIDKYFKSVFEPQIKQLENSKTDCEGQEQRNAVLKSIFLHISNNNWNTAHKVYKQKKDLITDNNDIEYIVSIFKTDESIKTQLLKVNEIILMKKDRRSWENASNILKECKLNLSNLTTYLSSFENFLSKRSQKIADNYYAINFKAIQVEKFDNYNNAYYAIKSEFSKADFYTLSDEKTSKGLVYKLKQLKENPNYNFGYYDFKAYEINDLESLITLHLAITKATALSNSISIAKVNINGRCIENDIRNYYNKFLINKADKLQDIIINDSSFVVISRMIQELRCEQAKQEITSITSLLDELDTEISNVSEMYIQSPSSCVGKYFRDTVKIRKAFEAQRNLYDELLIEDSVCYILDSIKPHYFDKCKYNDAKEILTTRVTNKSTKLLKNKRNSLLKLISSLNNLTPTVNKFNKTFTNNIGWQVDSSNLMLFVDYLNTMPKTSFIVVDSLYAEIKKIIEPIIENNTNNCLYDTLLRCQDAFTTKETIELLNKGEYGGTVISNIAELKSNGFISPIITDFMTSQANVNSHISCLEKLITDARIIEADSIVQRLLKKTNMPASQKKIIELEKRITNAPKILQPNYVVSKTGFLFDNYTASNGDKIVVRIENDKLPINNTNVSNELVVILTFADRTVLFKELSDFSKSNNILSYKKDGKQLSMKVEYSHKVEKYGLIKTDTLVSLRDDFTDAFLRDIDNILSTNNAICNRFKKSTILDFVESTEYSLYKQQWDNFVNPYIMLNEETGVTALDILNNEFHKHYYNLQNNKLKKGINVELKYFNSFKVYYRKYKRFSKKYNSVCEKNGKTELKAAILEEGTLFDAYNATKKYYQEKMKKLK